MKEGVDVEVAEGDLGSGGGIVDGWVGIGKDSVGVSEEAGEEVVLEVCTREGLAVLMLDGERLPVRGLEALKRSKRAGREGTGAYPAAGIARRAVGGNGATTSGGTETRRDCSFVAHPAFGPAKCPIASHSLQASHISHTQSLPVTPSRQS